MQENLVGYLLNSLDEDTHLEVEAYLREDPKARRQLELLRQALQPLEADREPPLPPPGLARRTLASVLQTPAKRLPRAPVLAGGAADAVRPFWRRADYLIAASILFIAVGLGAQGLYQMHFGRTILECQENLRQFATGFSTYRDMRGGLPDVTTVQAPRPAAGMVVPILMEAGVLPENPRLSCPNDDAGRINPASLAALRNMNPAQFEKQLEHLTSYAYSLGYRDDDGRYHAPRLEDESGAALPLLADGPPIHIESGNSRLHNGRGQNVLFHDGTVRFLDSRTPDGQDDIYLNGAKKVAAGLHKRDAVLGSSWARP